MSDSAPFFESSKAVQTPQVSEIDTSSIEIHLSSVGKLSLPPVIRIRDYSLDDSLLLATATESNLIGNLIQVLKNVVQGTNVNPANLHEQEVEEILLNIYASFWQKNMEFPYFPSQTEYETMPKEMKDAIDNGVFVPKVEIDLTTLGTKTLIEEFKEPFSLTEGEHVYSFRLPRIGDYIVAEEYIRQTYAFQEKDFQEIRSQLEFNEEVRRTDPTKMKAIDPVMFHKYTEYMNERGRKYLTVKQIQMLVAVDGKGLETLEDKFAAIVPLRVWSKIMKIIKERFSFGVNRDLKIKSPISGVELDWRAPFRFLDFIPTSDISDTTGDDIRFGV